MNFEHFLGRMSQPDTISLFILAPAALFAGFMTWRAPLAEGRATYTTYLLEGVTIEAAIVLIISAFSTRLFEWVGDTKIFIVIVALTTLIYAARDVFERVRRSDHGLAIDKGNGGNRKTNV